MADYFANILNVSVQGGVVILAVMALRLMLKKAPKAAVCLLWLLAGLRLLLPFQIESAVSLQPNLTVRLEWTAERSGGKPASGEILNSNGEVIAQQIPTESLMNSEPAKGEILNSDGEVLVEKPTSGAQVSVEEAQDGENVLLYIWLLGVAAMGASSLVAYLRLRRRVAGAVILSEGVWVTGNIDTAFVLGFLRPQIYLPADLTEQERAFVLAHERVHINRRDHWWKLLGFIALALHWFNPLVWVGYGLLCRDLEMACDESVVKSMDVGQRKAYSAALVNCSSIHHTIAACPVAFGEVSVKERVRNVLNYKKPGFWITLVAVLAAAFVAVFFLTSPGMSEEEILESLYSELEKMQNEENLHLSVSIQMEGEYDYFQGQEQEFWKSGEDWYRVIAYQTKEGVYEEHYLQIGDTQYVSRESEQIPRLESQDWFIMPEEYVQEPYVLLARDWTQCKVLEVKEEVSDDGGIYTVLIQGDLEGDSKTTYYAHTHAFHLDENFRLVGVVEYSNSDRFMESFDGTSGRFDMEGWSEVRFLEADEAEITGQIDKAARDAADQLNNAAELSEEEAGRLVRERATRLRQWLMMSEEGNEILLERCEEAILDFQSQENICLLVDNQFSGDILNDCSSVQHFQSGEDWLNITLISNADYSEEHYALEKDGEYYERFASVIHNPANGEGTDSGWVEDVDGAPCIPWVKTVQWDELLITSVDQETVDGKTRITLTIYGSPYEMEEGVTQYQVTFVFQNTELTAPLSQVALEFDKSWLMITKETGEIHVVSTIYLDAAAPEDASKRIEEMYAQVTE